jgi:putative Holliday junction resolvase
MTESAISVLGFDFGGKRIGVATGQTLTGTATPLTTLHQIQGNPDWVSIKKLIDEWQAQALIVGMPYHVDGSENPMTVRVKQFCYELEKRFKLPVHTIDESLSSKQAEEIVKENTKINQHNKHEIDKMAAAIIVQRWLDQHG